MIMRKRNLNRLASSIVLTLAFCIPSESLFGQSSPSYDRVAIDSLDADGWNGIVFLPEAFHQKVPFALRIGTQNGDAFLDGEKIFNAVREVGPHAPDGSYCRMAWNPPGSDTLIVLEWSRIDQTTVVGRLTASATFQFVLE